MEARQRKHAEYGNMLHRHEDHMYPSAPDQKLRPTNTFKSNIAFGHDDAQGAGSQLENKFKNQRDRQFAQKPLQPPATRQSYQDSDIFGTKAGSEIVQKSATIEKELRQRQSNTFARSDVLGNDEAANPTASNDTITASSSRLEKNWRSEVFSGPKPDTCNRKVLAKEKANRGDYYGNDNDTTDWQPKQSLAGALSKPTKPLYYQEEAAIERKNKELYGNSEYKPAKKGTGDLMTSVADWRNPQQTYTNAKNKVAPGLALGGEEDRKARKAAQLQSNILTHEDEDLKNARTQQWDNNGEKLQMASNASWNNQAGFQKPQNGGNVNAYRMRQNQLASQVLEQTDHTQHAPITKKTIDFNNYGRPATSKANNNSLKRGFDDGNGEVNKPTGFNQKTQKQLHLTSALDNHDYASYTKADEPSNDIYKEKQKYEIPTAVTPSQKQKQKFLSSNLLGFEATGSYNKNPQSVVDLDIKGLPKSCDEQIIKRVAGVKHIISSTIDTDNLKGTCTGTGRMKIRLNEGETLEQVKTNFIRAGYTVNEHTEDPRKKPIVTGLPKEEKIVMNAKDKKAHELATKFVAAHAY